MRDEVNEPLGRARPARESAVERARRLGPRYALWTAAAALALCGGELARRAGASGGGEPFAIARIEAAPPAPSVASAPVAAPFPSAASGALDAASTVKVVRNGGAPSGPQIIDVAQALGIRLAPAPDPRLIEASRYGVLPRIGADGARPADVYARPIAAARMKPGAPRIALLIGGLGLNTEGTTQAIAGLPADVTLGFAPYGGDLQREAAQARAAGHEIWLQAPMESFAGSTDRPGPHMLLAGAADAENLDSLRWLMSRFSGYVGIVNYLGGKFTADTRALSPVLAEIASRGLVYCDDGTSPRSVAGEAASALNLPTAKADVVIDADPSPEGVEAALGRLEALARERGGAIGVATARPASLALIARWAAPLEGRGVTLAPLSAMVARGPGPAAQVNP